MSSIYFVSTAGAREGIYCSMLQAWVIENFIFAARSLCILESFVNYGNLLLDWNYDPKKSDVENADDEINDEYAAPCKRLRNENAGGFGDQWMNDDEWQHENEDDTAGQQEGTGDSDNGDGDDNDDDNSDSDDHDEEEEEEEDVEDEEDEEEDEEQEEEEEERVPLSIQVRMFYSMAASVRDWFNDQRVGLLSLGGNVSQNPYRYEPFLEEYLSRLAEQNSNLGELLDNLAGAAVGLQGDGDVDMRDAEEPRILDLDPHFGVVWNERLDCEQGDDDEDMRDAEEPRNLDLDPYFGVDRNESIRDLCDIRG